MRSRVESIRKPTARSRITNGRLLLPKIIDGRSLWVRRCKDLIALHTQDLGGEDNVSEAERALIRRSSVLIVELERLEVKLAQSDDPAPTLLELYQRLSNSLSRMLRAIGLKRRAKDITPDPLSYARQRSHRNHHEVVEDD